MSVEISAKQIRLLSLWLVSLIVVNLIWSNVASMTAIQELNDFDREVDEFAQIELSQFFGSLKPMPVSIVTETSGGENSGESFTWSITDESGQEMYRWSGDYNTSIPEWSAELEPGLYSVQVQHPDFVSVKQYAEISPLAAHETNVRILLNLGLFLIAVIDFLIRNRFSKIESKPKSKSDYTPPSFKKVSKFDDSAEVVDDQSPWRDPIIGNQ